jgi:hypothetical protein
VCLAYFPTATSQTLLDLLRTSHPLANRRPLDTPTSRERKARNISKANRPTAPSTKGHIHISLRREDARYSTKKKNVQPIRQVPRRWTNPFLGHHRHRFALPHKWQNNLSPAIEPLAHGRAQPSQFRLSLFRNGRVCAAESSRNPGS